MLNFIGKLWKDRGMRNRMLFTLFILVVFRIGATITIPGITVSQTSFSDNDFFGMINLLGGGALSQFSLFALGVSPYITASIVVQLLAADVVPSLTKMSKEGQKGKAKLDRVTKWVTLIFAFVQGFALTAAMRGQGIISSSAAYNDFFTVFILVAGTMTTMWLADQISKKGFGNGMSLIIFTGIVSAMPYQFQQTFSILVDTTTTSTVFMGLLNFAGFLVIYLGIILLVIAVSGATRKIPIQQVGSKVTTSQEMSFLPLKLNSSGVIPVIFASAVMTAPTVVFALMPDNETGTSIVEFLSLQSLTGFTTYIILIILFTYFYSNYVSINPEQLAKNFETQRLYIPGVKPGDETRVYVRKSLNRLNFFGSLYLIIIVTLPVVAPMVLNINTNLPIGGTSLIIAVGVSVELYKQVQGRMATSSYNDVGQMLEQAMQKKMKEKALEAKPGKKGEAKKDDGGLIW